MEEVLEIFTTWEYFKDKIKTSHVSCSHVFVRNEHWRFHTGMWPKAPVSPSAHQACWQSYQTSYPTELRYVPLRSFPGVFEYLFICIILNLKAQQGK